MPQPSRRTRSGRAVDDAPAGEGTLFADAPETAEAAVPDEPEWLRDVPLPGDVPQELSADERRARDDAQKAEQAAKSAARAKEIVGRLNPEQARAVTTTEGAIRIPLQI